MKSLSKQKEVQARISEYNQTVAECMVAFRATLARCSDDFDRDVLRRDYESVHAAEGRADDIRRSLVDMMYTQALFPESRGDILGLIEAMDKVPNHTEESVRMILNQHIELPQGLCSRLLRLVEVSCESVRTMIEGVDQLFGSFLEASVTVGKIDKLESEADAIEAELTDSIFSGGHSDLQKILLRDLVEHIAGIADRAENVGDRIRLIVAKRSV